MQAGDTCQVCFSGVLQDSPEKPDHFHCNCCGRYFEKGTEYIGKPDPKIKYADAFEILKEMIRK